MGKSKTTVGAAASKLQEKASEYTAEDLQKAIQESNDEGSFENQVRECVERGCVQFDHDFYVVVLFKKEKIMHNVIRQYFIPRLSCPTPEWDQTVYYFNRSIGEIHLLWSIPDKNICEYMLSPMYIPEVSEFELYKYVQAFNDGSLLKESKKRNKEQKNSNIIEK